MIQSTDATRKTIIVDGLDLAYVEKGEGQPVVCVHGNPGMCTDFLYQETDGFRIIAFDRPGHGFSGRYTDKSDHLNLQVRYMRRFIEAKAIEKPILAGHSWGCFVILAYALAYPDDVKGLILMGPVVYQRGGSGAVGGIVKVLQTKVLGPLVTRLLAGLLGLSVDKKVGALFAPDPMPEDYRKTALPLFLRPLSVKSMLEDKVGFEAVAGSVSQRYPEIKAKAIVGVGDSDTVAIDGEQRDALSRALEHSKMVRLKDTGHQIPHLRKTFIKDHIAYFSESEESTHG